MTEQTMASTPQNPFNFLFYYQLPTGDEVDNVLLREQATTVSPLHLMIGNALKDKVIVLTSPSIKDANKDNFHFKLQFKPQVLLDPEQIDVGSNEWSIFYQQETNKDDAIYLLWTGDNETLTSNNSIEIIINGVATNSSSIGTNVTLHWEYTEIENGINIGPKVPNQNDPYTTNSTVYLRIKKYQGNPNIPLFVGFTGSNRVLNTNAQKSSLQLRLTNISDSKTPNSVITFNSESKLIVALEVGDQNTVPWALGTQDNLDGIGVKIDGGWEPRGDKPQEVKTKDGVKALEWTFDRKDSLELTAQQTLLVNLNDIETAHPTGMANLYLRYQNVPGYRDGEFICPIEKAPLVFPEKNVGIGTTVPKQSLHIHKDGNIFLHNGEIQNSGSLIFRSDADNNGDKYVAKFFKQDQSAPLMVLDKEGNVGIGTTSPSAKLHVNGGFIKIDSSTEKNQIEFVGGGTIYKNDFKGLSNGLRIKPVSEEAGVEIVDPTGYYSRLIVRNGKVGISTGDPQAELHVNGRIKDKTGFVIPVGTIVPYIGSNAPQGWFLCNGQEFNGDDFPDLKEILGGTTLPRLQGRFIVGAGTTLDDVVYNLGDKGGEAKHKLTIGEMPSHNHEYNDSYKHLLKLGNNTTDGDIDNTSGEPCLTSGRAIQPAGGDQPHENRPPYFALNYIIKA